MATKAERIVELLDIINNKSGRIKKLKFECGRQETKICVLSERIKELEENAKIDLKETKRLRSLVSELCEERDQALKG